MRATPSELTAPAGSLADQYSAVRRLTERLCEPLTPEDMQVQSMPDASPAKWHLAHTTWFFETFLLARRPGHRPFDPAFGYLFNSYYEAVGPRHPRPQRGVLSRPTAEAVFRYRHAVDEQMLHFLGGEVSADDQELVTLGLNHEQQHQELLVTDVKHAFGSSVLRPAYRAGVVSTPAKSRPLGWVDYPEGVRAVGHDGTGFAFDNESPRHRAFLEAFALADRLVTCGEFAAFIDDGGYRRPELWLSDGWSAVQRHGWDAPLYWRRDGGWRVFTLAGERELDPAEPACHVSYFEADAYARWAGARLPTEAEWEAAATGLPIAGNFLDSGRLHPAAPHPQEDHGRLAQMFGDAWEWTASAYLPYPNFRPAAGAVGEYNGKFMNGQYVLRGGSCATPAGHVRPSYRNFFPPEARWQFTAIRLARGV